MADIGDFSLSFPAFEGDFDGIDEKMFEEPFVEEISEATLVNESGNDIATITGMEETKKETRFKSLDSCQLEELTNARYSKASRINAKWGFNTFNDWCTEKCLNIDLHTIEEGELATHLTRFYAEIAPKPSQHRQSQEYHKNSLKNIRSALNRYIQVECGRPLNIVSDYRFKKCNDMLNGKLKYNARHGLSAPTVHKRVIHKNHMTRINEYLKVLNPITLRYRVWMQLGIHFCSRGLEFHCQLSPRSFCFQKDEMGMEYVTLAHNTQQKNHQGDFSATDENPDKRMYETGDDLCPVQSLKILISKTPSDAAALFNHLEKTLPDDPSSSLYWYSSKAVGRRQFSNFMPDICRNAGLSERYTAHCLRATALSIMTDNNVPGRHIMSLSDHKNESSLMAYTRPSSTHKQNMSRILADLFRSPENRNNATITSLENSEVQSSVSIQNKSPTKSALDASLLKGFITESNCTFSSCTFEIYQK